MPIFDPVEQRMTVRVVYDGVAYAGKTTNLKQLGALFAAQRRTTVESPADLFGRTLYFDWMQITAGVVCGFPLSCQVVSVPGQAVLGPRRRSLMMDADVVVCICESHPSAIETAREALRFYDEIASRRGEHIPLVIQANKQDRPGALDGVALLKALGREGIPCVEAIAHEGIGVVDTFVSGIRTVVRDIQRRAERETLRVRVRCAETQNETFLRTAREPIDPSGAAELLLEAAHALFAPVERTTVDAPTRAAAAELEHMTDEAHLTEKESVTDQKTVTAQEAVTDQKTVADQETVTDQETVADRESGADQESVTVRPPSLSPATTSAPVASAAPAEVEKPPTLPSADVPTGFIWPAHTGRATVRRLGLEPMVASRREHGWSITTGGHVVSTSAHARYSDVEAARQALVRRAREHTQLEHLLVPETVLVAQPSSDGCWIWTVRPDLPTVEQAVRDGSVTPRLVTNLGVAIVEALRCGLRHGFSFAPSGESFAVQQGIIRFIGEITAEPIDAGAFSRAVAATAAALSGGIDAATFMDAVQRELERRLTREELAAFVVSTA